MAQAGIYIHIPFCERKCTYCNFNTTDYFEDLASKYVQAVAKEIRHWGERLRGEGNRVPVDSIFFGGGTPSIVRPELLERLIAASRDSWDLSEHAEITIEINPGSFSREKLKAWRQAGINRASVGVQSFIDRELAALSRTHTAQEARRTLGELREAGFDNLSLDLIAGFPDQTLSDWEMNLSEALAIAPEHLSLYLLEVKEGTQLFSQIKRGSRPQPDEDLAAEMYRRICQATKDEGYEHYEISNFAIDSGGQISYRSKHNMKYWTGTAFYGMGCGAHSFDGRARWSNILKTETYIDSVEATGSAIADLRDLSEGQRAEEALFMGLRLSDGVDLKEFGGQYGVDVIERYGDELPRLVEAGLIEVAGERLRLTESGMLLSNEVFVSFV